MISDKQKFLDSVGQLIRTKRRLTKKWSLEELAWHCGISKNALGSIELAKGDVKLSTIANIFDVLDINFSELQKIKN